MKNETLKEPEIFDENLILVDQVEKKGRLIAVDLLLRRDGNFYMLTAGTAEFIEETNKIDKQELNDDVVFPIYLVEGNQIDTSSKSPLAALKIIPLDQIKEYLIPQD